MCKCTDEQNHDDPELEALRQKRLQQLMAQQGLTVSVYDGLLDDVGRSHRECDGVGRARRKDIA